MGILRSFIDVIIRLFRMAWRACVWSYQQIRTRVLPSINIRSLTVRFQSTWARFRGMRRRTQAAIWASLGTLLLCSCCGGLAAYGSTLPSATNTTAVNQQNQHPAATATRVLIVTAPVPGKTPATKATAVVTATAQATATTAPQATPVPQPTQPVIYPTATPRPRPTATPAPKYPPINGNPYDYNFQCCNLIYSPPGDICNWFACIGNFFNGTGFMNECNDGDYSMSGGHRGDCSYHGGELRPVYAP